jgi:hypothetical protein
MPFFFIEEADGLRPIYVLTPVRLVANDISWWISNRELSSEEAIELGMDGPWHDPWPLSMATATAMYRSRNDDDDERFATVTWLDIDNIQHVLSGYILRNGGHPLGPHHPGFEYTVTDQVITIPAALLIQPPEGTYVGIINDHINQILEAINDDHGVPNSSIGDQMRAAVEQSHWGLLTHLGGHPQTPI